MRVRGHGVWRGLGAGCVGADGGKRGGIGRTSGLTGRISGEVAIARAPCIAESPETASECPRNAPHGLDDTFIVWTVPSDCRPVLRGLAKWPAPRVGNPQGSHGLFAGSSLGFCLFHPPSPLAAFALNSPALAECPFLPSVDFGRYIHRLDCSERSWGIIEGSTAVLRS